MKTFAKWISVVKNPGSMINTPRDFGFLLVAITYFIALRVE